MKTPTHLLLGHVLAKNLPGSDPRMVSWVMAGAVMPDAPVFVVGLFSWLQTICEYVGLSFVARMDSLYFDNAGFIALHHLLHSPTSLALLFCCGFALQRRDGTDFRAVWFLCGAATHSLTDIFTHADDGILVFWPLNWNYRFNSGVDQWNMQGAGLWLASFEAVFVLGYGGWLLWKASKPFVFLRVSPNLHSEAKEPKIYATRDLGRSPLLALVSWCRSICWCGARPVYQQR